MGKIICGFPGIGKSTLVRENFNNNTRYIDFESSHFDKTNENWVNEYCNCVIDLALNQNFDVLCSSHSAVVDTLSKHVEVYLIYPCSNLKRRWREKVRERYKKSPTMKNQKALVFVDNYFDTAVETVEKYYVNNENIVLLPITSMDYTLEEIIKNAT